MDTTLIRECVKALRLKNWKIAFVESATAGRMCSEFALVPDSGDVLIGGLSCYKVFVKEKILDVPHDLIEKYTPESAEVTRALAENAAPFFKSDVTVAVTGLVSPGEAKPRKNRWAPCSCTLFSRTATLRTAKYLTEARKRSS